MNLERKLFVISQNCFPVPDIPLSVFNGTYILFSCTQGGVICKDPRESIWSWTNIMMIGNRPGPHQKKG